MQYSPNKYLSTGVNDFISLNIRKFSCIFKVFINSTYGTLSVEMIHTFKIFNDESLHAVVRSTKFDMCHTDTKCVVKCVSLD